MRRLYYSAGAIVATVALPLTASAGGMCDAIANCVTVACYAITIAGCVGGTIIGSIIW